MLPLPCFSVSAAVKLLRLMGWRDGHGTGPRIKRKLKDPSSNIRVVGPTMPPEHDKVCRINSCVELLQLFCHTVLM